MSYPLPKYLIQATPPDMTESRVDARWGFGIYEILDKRNNFQKDFEDILLEETAKEARHAPGVLAYDWWKDKNKSSMYIAVEIYANKKCEFMLYNKSL